METNNENLNSKEFITVDCFGLNDITVGQFVDYVTKHNFLNYKLRVQYRDDGGDYYGCDSDIRCYEETDENGEKFLIL